MSDLKALMKKARAEMGGETYQKFLDDLAGKRPNENHHRCLHCGDYFDECQCGGALP